MITLKTLAAATDQEVFDQVATHLLKQNAKSLAKNGTPAYHGPNGMQCACGCLISDDEYDQKMEGVRWGSLVMASTDRRKFPDLFPPAHVRLLRSLQLLHDTRPVNDWRRALKMEARRYGLQWTHEPTH